MHIVASFVKDYNTEILLGLAALSLFFIIMVISLSVRISKLSRRRNAHLESGQVGDIVDYITGVSNTLDSVKGRLEEISDNQHDMNKSLISCVQNVGMVRFDAFDDVGGEQSFALALLDDNKNGVVVSSLYGRQDSRVYIKGVVGGEGERALSDDEKRALKAAQQ